MDNTAGSDTGVGNVADHREIRHEKQQNKLKPTALAPVIRKQTEHEDGRTFQMEEWSGIHVASP